MGITWASYDNVWRTSGDLRGGDAGSSNITPRSRVKVDTMTIRVELTIVRMGIHLRVLRRRMGGRWVMTLIEGENRRHTSSPTTCYWQTR